MNGIPKEIMETLLYLLLFPPNSLGVLLVIAGVVSSVGGGVVTSWVVLTVTITVIFKKKTSFEQ